MTPRDAEALRWMRAAGRVIAEMHEVCARAAKPGATTAELNAAASQVLELRNATSNFLGYHGFPAVICASVNTAVVHGIPNGDVLRDGDIVSIDCGAIVNGWHADAAITVPVGDVDEEARRLIDATRAALSAAIACARPGVRLGAIGAAIETTVGAAGFAVVEDYSGHGIGRAMHEPPEVANFAGGADRKVRLELGNTIAIEPIVVTGDATTDVLADGWTVVTKDGGRAAHFEHTIAIGPDGAEVLTLPWGPLDPPTAPV
ncbi:MAG: type I methionyl aminopeptidase [Acidimicrobiia bacterium]